jgi:ABC-2 type transport system ATP-binding protein
VLFSSHLLDEVEQVADHITMISRGQIVLGAPLRAIKDSHRRITVRFAEPRPAPPAVAAVLRWDRADGSGQEWTAVVRGGAGALDPMPDGARIVAERAPSLDEVFVAHVGAPVAAS